jgi:hypothetical protein
MFRVCAVIAVLILLVPRGNAQTSNANDQETIQRLVQQVRELQQKVAILEGKQSTASPTPENPPDAIQNEDTPRCGK